MINKRRLLINASTSVIQIVVSALVLFFLYKYLLEIIGAEKLGVWTLVLAVSSMAQLANLGLTGSIVKFIASYSALGDERKVVLAIQTAALSLAVASTLLMAGMFPVAKYYLSIVLGGNNLKEALEILPLGLLCFWFSMVTGIYQGALYGSELIDQRNWILILDSVMHFILCTTLATKYGLVGLAYARLIQNIITLNISLLVLKMRFKGLPVIPFQWDKKIFKEMFGYAVNFQLITLLVMLSDPVTKGFLSKFGSVSMVSYYEMANKLVQIVRSLIVSANQVLVPSFARLKEVEPHRVSEIYSKSYQIVFFLTVPCFSILAVSSPLISYLWIGKFEYAFVIAMIFLCGGWMLNTLSVPAYFSGVGTGDMKENVLSHLLTTVINIVLILIIGESWGGIGIIIAWASSLAIGGVVLNLLYRRKNKLSLSDLVPAESRLLVLQCFLGVGISYIIWKQQFVFKFFQNKVLSDMGILNQLIADSSIIIIFILVIIVPIWRNKIRKNIMSWVFK